jgi:hypothetical protein
MPSFSANLRLAAKAGWIVRAASRHLRNPPKGQSEVPDILEEGTYPKALWFVSRTYLRAVKGFHQRGDVEDRLGYYVGHSGAKRGSDDYGNQRKRYGI